MLSVPELKEVLHWLMSTRRRSMSMPLVPLEWHGRQQCLRRTTGGRKIQFSLEEVFAVLKSKEWYSVSHHPDVAPAAVVVGLDPLAVLVAHGEDKVCLPMSVSRRVEGICMISWGRANARLINSLVQQILVSFLAMHFKVAIFFCSISCLARALTKYSADLEWVQETKTNFLWSSVMIEWTSLAFLVEVILPDISLFWWGEGSDLSHLLLEDLLAGSPLCSQRAHAQTFSTWEGSYIIPWKTFLWAQEK